MKDLAITHYLECPSHTVEWLPGRNEPPGKEYSVQKMILGTHPSHNEPNYLMIAQVQLPLKYPEIHDYMADEGIFDCENLKVQIIQKINHDGKVNKARYMPHQNPSIIATKTVSGEVYVFDYSKHPTEPPPDSGCNPDLRLRGHNDEGYGLSWNKLKEGHLLSGSIDAQICLWDINATPDNKTLEPMRMFKVDIIQGINHEGEVKKARYMPENPSIIATKTVSGEVYVFDYSKHPPEPPPDSGCNPDLRLRGHNKEGYGLSWSNLKKGHLLSGSKDSQICLWDINGTPTNKTLEPMRMFKAHEGAVNDVAWHARDENLFGSVGDDGYLRIWDLREKTAHKSVVAHKRKVNCLAFNPLNEHFVATGSVDETLKLFDLRNIDNVFHTYFGHEEGVTQVGWSPKYENILVSACQDSPLAAWDLTRISDNILAEDIAFFIHEGHTSQIYDFSWNSNEDWVLASVAADNILQIWLMTDR